MSTINKLTPEQKKFVNAYVKNGGNGRQAVKASNRNKINDNSADVKASRLLRCDKVQKAIDSKLGQITIDEITQAVKDIALNDSNRNNDRLKALDMLYKHKGGYAPQQLELKQIDVSEQVQQARARANKLKSVLLEENVVNAVVNNDTDSG